MTPEADDNNQTSTPKQQSQPTNLSSPSFNSSQPQPTTATSRFPMKSKPNRKKLFAIIATTVVVVLVGSSYAAYALWYNNPTKVSDDAFRSILSAKSASYTGKAEFTPAGSGSGGVVVDFDGKGDAENSQVNMKLNVNMAPMTINLGMSFIGTKAGDSYFKIDNAKGILDTFASAMGGAAEANPQLTSLTNKLDNKWVKITQADLKELNSSGDDQQTVCLQKTITDFQSNKAQQDQLYKAFNENRFVKIDKELGSAKIGNSTSNGYELGVDAQKAKSFGKAAEQIDVIKSVQKCVGEDLKAGEDSSEEATNKSLKTKVEVWADKWSHQLTRLKVTVEDEQGKMAINLDPQLNTTSKVTVPTDNITLFKDLKADVEALVPAGAFQGEEAVIEDELLLN